jgi:hypothetical protein
VTITLRDVSNIIPGDTIMHQVTVTRTGDMDKVT